VVTLFRWVHSFPHTVNRRSFALIGGNIYTCGVLQEVIDAVAPDPKVSCTQDAVEPAHAASFGSVESGFGASVTEGETNLGPDGSLVMITM